MVFSLIDHNHFTNKLLTIYFHSCPSSIIDYIQFCKWSMNTLGSSHRPSDLCLCLDSSNQNLTKSSSLLFVSNHGMCLHGFEGHIFPDHIKWSSLEERERDEQSEPLFNCMCTDHLQSIKRLIIGTELLPVRTRWTWLRVELFIMQWWFLYVWNAFSTAFLFL